MALTPKTLMLWVQKVTEGFPGLGNDVINFTTSWQNGLGFCAIIVRYKPKLIDYYSLDPNDWATNLQIAFDKAESIGIPKLLQVSDMLVEVPDKLLVMTYLSQYHNSFHYMLKSSVPQPPRRAPAEEPRPDWAKSRTPIDVAQLEASRGHQAEPATGTLTLERKTFKKSDQQQPGGNDAAASKPMEVDHPPVKPQAAPVPGGTVAPAPAAPMEKAPAFTLSNDQKIERAESTQSTDLCAVCSKKVFILEKLAIENVVFHKSCFKCSHCAVPLTLGTSKLFGEKAYCTPHFNLISQIGVENYEEVKAKRQLTSPVPPENAGNSPKKSKVSEGSEGERQPKVKKSKEGSEDKPKKSKKPADSEGKDAKEESEEKKKKKKSKDATGDESAPGSPVGERDEKKKKKKAAESPEGEPDDGSKKKKLVIKKKKSEGNLKAAAEQDSEELKKREEEAEAERLKVREEEDRRHREARLLEEKRQAEEEERRTEEERRIEEAYLLEENQRREAAEARERELQMKKQRREEAERKIREEEERKVREESARLEREAKGKQKTLEAEALQQFRKLQREEAARRISEEKKAQEEAELRLQEERRKRQEEEEKAKRKREEEKRKREEEWRRKEEERKLMQFKREEEERALQLRRAEEELVRKESRLREEQEAARLAHDQASQPKSHNATSDEGSSDESEDGEAESETKGHYSGFGEIQQTLEDLERRQSELSTRGIQLETEIRKRLETTNEEDEEELLAEWFALVSKRNELVMKEDEIRIKEEEKTLEILGESIDKSLRAALAKSEKTSSEQEEEEWLISLWVDTVKKRDALVQLEEENRKAGFDLDIRWAQDQIIITIPEVIQTSDSPPYFLYVIHILIKGVAEWVIRRRYSQFRDELYEKWKGAASNVPHFPGKKIMGKADVIAEERRPQLQHYLQGLVNHVAAMPGSPLLSADPKESMIRLLPFFGPECDIQPPQHSPRAERRGTLSKAAGGFWTKS